MNALLKLLPGPTREGTARKAIEALSSLGVERSKITYDPAEFQLLVDGNRIWLGNLQAQCRLVWPWQRGAMTRAFLACFLEKPDRPRTIEDARPHLLPGVRDSFMFEVLRLQSRLEGLEDPGPSGHALGSRLWLSAFLDYPNATSVVTRSDLSDWGASSERSLELGLENLAARSKEGLVPVAEGVYHSPWQDCYDPARILLRDILAPLDLRGDPVAFAPNWNHLIVTGSEDLAGLGVSLLFAMKVVAEEPRPMSALPLVRRGGEWVDFDLPAGHPLEPLLRKARVLELGQIYPEQAALVERIHEKDGTDVFVATYTALRDPKTDDHRAYAQWSRDVVTLLPRAESVVFFDDGRPEGQKVVGEIAWPIVALHCAPLLKDAGFTPPRFLVEAFPTDEQLEAMRAAQATRSAAAASPAS